MISFIKKSLSCPFAVLAGIAAISAFSLAAALTAEIVFGLEPCILCTYQRFPFMIALIISLLGLLLCKANRTEFTSVLVAVCGLSFLVNSLIATYHSGIERKWWSSALEGCTVHDFGNDQQSMLEKILSTPAARCDEIPWADPILGLSMANYNVFLCFILFVICAIYLLSNTERT